MLNSQDSETYRAVLSRLSNGLLDIRQGVLAYCIQGERLVVEDITLDADHTSPPRKHLLVTFHCDAGAFVHLLPTNIAEDYWDLRYLSWLESETLFTTPFDFYMGHYMLANNRYAPLPAIDRVPESIKTEYPIDFLHAKTPILNTHALLTRDSTYPNLPYHGLERTVLDFDASEYFSLFGVRVQPFDNKANHKDEHLVGAADFVQHCKELTIIFGKTYCSANPWAYLAEDQWDPDAAARMHICDLGLVVDWILEYAWAGEYIQHIPQITIKGPLQPWIREKWATIFAAWHSAKEIDSAAKWQDVYSLYIEAIETRAMISGRLWLPEFEYPPECHCARACWELAPEAGWAATEPEAPLQRWEEFKEELVGTMEWDMLRDKYGPLDD